MDLHERLQYEDQLMKQYTNASKVPMHSTLRCYRERIRDNFDSEFVIEIRLGPHFPFIAPEAYIVFPVIPEGNSYHLHKGGKICFSAGSFDSSTTAYTVRCAACMWCLAFELYVIGKSQNGIGTWII